MNDNYFDKKIREILQRPPEFEPGPAARKDMLRRLDALGRARRRPPVGWWWLLFPAGILLGWWLAQLGTPRSQTIAAHTHQRDTIVVEKWHTTRDTIVLIQHQPLMASSAPVTAPKNRKSLLHVLFDPNISTWKQSNLSGTGGPTDRLLPTSGGASAAYVPPLSLAAKDARKPTSLRHRYAAAPAIGLPALRPLDPLRRRDPLLDDDRILLPPLLEHTPELPLWVHFVPTGFSAGLEAGPTYIPDETFEEQSGWALRLSGRFHLAEGSFLQTGVGLLRLSFMIEDNELLFSFPTVNPDSPDDKLHDIYADDLRILEVPVLLGWQSQWGSWRPFIAAGVTARKPLRQQLRYEFINSNQEEYYLPVRFNQSHIDLHTWSVHVGMGRKLWRGLSANAALRFEKDWRKGADDLVRLQYLAPALRLEWEF